MCFKLAKDLRLLGIDTAYVAEKDVDHLMEVSLEEKRVIVTRDKSFA